MINNIVFKSNVYPTQIPLLGDQSFISKISDYYRLKELKERAVFSSVKPNFSSFQMKVISEQPQCSLAKGDPCYGLMYENDKPSWVCRCVKKECGNIKECRPDLEENEYKLFSPNVNSAEGYEYEYNFYDIKRHPVKANENNIQYESNEGINVNNFIVDGHEYLEEVVDIISVIEKIEVEVEKKVDDFTEIDKFVSNQDSELNLDDSLEIQVKNEFDFINNNMFDEFKEVTQDEIIMADAKDIIFIDAGPGTGKTYTLINRINHMVRNQGVDPEYIVVVSFTNAAVVEVKERLEEFIEVGGNRGLRNVDKRTFHSLAWYIVNQANEDDELIGKGWFPILLSLEENNYDLCIEAASKVIRCFPEFIAGWHIIIDEIQDLTGAKSVFVKMLLNACIKNGTGVTIFGDYCQAIYDYTENDDSGSMQFYKDSFRIVWPVGWFGRLIENHRQNQELQKLTFDYRNAILDNDLKKMKEEVSSINGNMAKIDKTYINIGQEDFDEFSTNDSICLMCRNNGQVLKLTSAFRKNGINHMVNVYNRVQYFDNWIAEVFSGTDLIEVNESFFFDKLKGFGYIEEDVREMWSSLCKTIASKSEYICIDKILDGVRLSKADNSIFHVNKKHNLIVSNIHRAKGREYNTVILDSQFVSNLYKKDHDVGEYKALYVALTRPKKNIRTCELSKPFEVKRYPKSGNRTKRWGTYRNGKFTHLEILFEDDVNLYSYAKNELGYINSYGVEIGDEIILRRIIINESRCEYDIYHLKNDVEHKIGSMTDAFITELQKFISPEEIIDMPEYIDDLYVDNVFSHISDSELFNNYEELKSKFIHPVWSCVDFRGLGHLRYDTY